MIRIFYNIVLFIGFLFYFPVAAAMSFFVEKRKKTFWQRLGFQLVPGTGPMRPVWVHALSVGEMRAAVPLVRSLAKTGPVVVSASTATGFLTAKEMLGDCARAVFLFPYDLPWSVRRAVKQVNPSAFVLVETDLWPNFLHHLASREVPCFLVNSRLSESTYHGYKRFSFLFSPMLKCFAAAGAQSGAQKERLADLGMDEEAIQVTGNLKFDQEKPDDAVVDSLAPIRSSFVLVCGSTHPGEEKMIRDLLEDWRTEIPGLLVLVAPRDPLRAAGVASMFSEKGLAAPLYSDWDPATRHAEVVVVDKLGVLASLYGRAHVCFIGGSLVDEGGHNPLEPAAWEKPVIFGPHMEDFPEIARILVESGAAIQVGDASGLSSDVMRLWKDPEKAARMGQSGSDILKENRGATQKTVRLILDAMEKTANAKPQP